MVRRNVIALGLALFMCVAPARSTRLLVNATGPELPIGGPIETRNIFQDLWSTAKGVTTALADAAVGDKCIHGNNCGWRCSRGMDNGAPSVDDLDAACYEHDVCLADSDDQCACDYALIDTANQIASDKKCSWWEIWCTDSAMVENAPLVAKFIETFALPYHGC